MSRSKFIISLKQKRGQLLVSLMYVPLEGRLVLGILKASNLRAMDLNGSSGFSSLIAKSSNHIKLRSVYKNMAALPRPANGEKEDSGQEKHAQSGIQRAIRVFHSDGEAQRLHARSYCNGQGQNRAQ